MAIAYSAPTVGTTTNGTSVSVNNPNGAGSTGLCVVELTANLARTWTVPAGWTSLGAGDRCAAMYRILDGSESGTFNFGVTGANALLRAGSVTITGLHPTSPIDASSFQQVTAQSSNAIPGVTVVNGGELFSLAFRHGSTGALTEPAGMTQLFEDNSIQSFSGCNQAITPGATGTRTWTWSVVSSLGGLLLSLRTAPLTGSPSDSITLTDALVKGPNSTRADTIILSDAATKGIGKRAADTVALADVLGKTITKPIADVLTLSDSPSKGLAPASLADGLAFGDAVTARLVKAVGDTLTLADSSTVAHRHVESDTITLTDSPARTITPATHAETLVLSDELRVALTKAPADTISLADSLRATVNKRPADGLTLSDALSAHPRVAAADSITLTDNDAHALALRLEDSLGLTDHLDVPIIFPIADTLGLVDELTFHLNSSLGDILELTDTPNRHLTLYLYDALSLTDSDSRALAHDLDDALILSDTVARTVAKQLVDQLLLDDSGVALALTLSLADGLTLTDELFSVTGSKPDMYAIAELIGPRWTARLIAGTHTAELLSRWTAELEAL